MRKWYILFIVILLSIIGYNYIYQNHRNIEKEVATFYISSTTISNEFAKKPIESEKAYLNKTIEITGSITEINKKNLTLNKKVFCQFDNKLDYSIKINSNVKIKGRVIGYDDLLEQVKLDQCTIIMN